MTKNAVGNIDARDHATVQIGNNYNNCSFSSREPGEELLNNAFAQRFSATDPREDKLRIEKFKGGLINEVSNWVLQTSEFKRWRDDPQTRLLWIRGDAGTGKTMLLCRIIDELAPFSKSNDRNNDSALAFYFCEATKSAYSHAANVIDGLIYLLINQQRSLLSHLPAVIPDMNHHNSLVARTKILKDMLQDSALQGAYIVIDALDECEKDLESLLDIIEDNSLPVKWIVSSRDWPAICERTRIVLSVDNEPTLRAIKVYVDHRLRYLQMEKGFDDEERAEIYEHLVSNASGTFLWVALMCQQMKSSRTYSLWKDLKKFPARLNEIYERMMQKVLECENGDLPKRVLAIMLIVRQPITIMELSHLSGAKTIEGLREDPISGLREVIADCGSFITLQEPTVGFIHTTAMEFLDSSSHKDQLLPLQGAEVHEMILSNSIEAMEILQQDMYGVDHPGIHIDELAKASTQPDPLAGIQYACAHWTDHLCNIDLKTGFGHILCTDGILYDFLSTKFLFWLEMLCLQRKLPEGILGISKLKGHLETMGIDPDSKLLALINDGDRFARYFQPIIEHYPLQLYESGMIFSPSESIIRKLFERRETSLVVQKPQIQPHWGLCPRMFRFGPRWSTTFSFSGTLLGVLGQKGNIDIWDLGKKNSRTYDLQFDLTARCLALSQDCLRVAGLFHEKALQVWNVNTKELILQKECPVSGLFDPSIAFSHNGKYVAVSSQNSIRLWDMEKKTMSQMWTTFRSSLEFDKSELIFSPDDNFVAIFCSSTSRILGECQVFDVETGGKKCNHVVKQQGYITAVAFKSNTCHLVYASNYGIGLLDLSTKLYSKWPGFRRLDLVKLAISPDGGRMAFAISGAAYILIYELGRLFLKIKINSEIKLTVPSEVKSLSFSPNGTQLATSCADGTVWILDIETPKPHQVYGLAKSKLRLLHGSAKAYTIDNLFNAGACLVSVSKSAEVQLREWKAGAEWEQQPSRCKIDTRSDNTLGLSSDGRRLAALTGDGRLLFWDLHREKVPATSPLTWFYHYWKLYDKLLRDSGYQVQLGCVAVSPNGQLLVVQSQKGHLHIWDTNSNEMRGKIKESDAGFGFEGSNVVFSPDGQCVVMVNRLGDKVLIWKTTTGAIKTLSIKIPMAEEGHVKCIAVSPSNGLLALSCSETLLLFGLIDGGLQQEYSMLAGKIRFTSESTILTNRGTLDLEDYSYVCGKDEDKDSTAGEDYQLSGCGLSKDQSWVTWNGQNVLWIPTEYCIGTKTMAIAMDMVAYYNESTGQVSIIKFAKDTTARLSRARLQPTKQYL